MAKKAQEETLASAFSVFGSDSDDDDDDDGSQTLPTLLPRLSAAETTLRKLTVKLTEDERSSTQFHETTIRRAAAVLREHGLVIIPKLFNSDSIISLGSAALADLDAALVQAETRLSTKPGCEALYQFRELASRQHGRFELRNGEALRIALASSTANLTTHEGIFSVMREACGPPGQPLDPYLTGDGLVARDVGAFVSRPGANDQPVHADNGTAGLIYKCR